MEACEHAGVEWIALATLRCLGCAEEWRDDAAWDVAGRALGVIVRTFVPTYEGIERAPRQTETKGDPQWT